MTKGSVTWEALEYNQIEKNTDWYWAVSIIAISVTLISVILGNIIFAIVVVVSTFALIVSARRNPKIVNFEINKQGLYIDNEFRPYSELKSFWVDDNSQHDGISKLYIRQRGMTAGVLHIPLENVDPEEVRNYLLEVLLEEEHTESILHKFFEYLGF